MGARFTKVDLRRAVEVARETGATVEVEGDVIRIVPTERAVVKLNQPTFNPADLIDP